MFTQTKVEGLIRRANLHYPNADLRRLHLVVERGLDRSMIAGLGTCSFIDRQQNVVFQDVTGSENRIWGARWRKPLACTECEHITSGCLSSKMPGSWPAIHPPG